VGPSAGVVTRPVVGKGGTVQVGFFISKNAEAFFKTFGFDGLSPGDQEHQVKVIVAYLNAHGGLQGRKIEPIFGIWDATAGNTVSQREAACAKWTQDHHVVAMIAEAFDSFTGCSNRNKVPLIASTTVALTKEELNRTPLMATASNPTDERFHPAWVAALDEAGYFKGTATAPRRLGVIYLDTPPQRRSFQHNLVPALKRHGVTVESSVGLSTTSAQEQIASLQNSVLKFQTERITHVMFMDSGGQALLFSTQAESQGYRPRYGISTYSAPLQLQTAGRKEQLVGSVGVGWNRSIDVAPEDRPADNAAGKLCVAIMEKAGIDMKADGTRSSAFNYCDMSFTLAAAANRAPTLSSLGIMQGLDQLGPAVHSVGNGYLVDFRGHRDGVAEVRPFAFAAACGCYRYTNGTHRRI
jgi:ABC-type branched-subunit amino acid transport system substrate-binding protein